MALQPNPFSYPRAQWLPYGARDVAEQFVENWWIRRFMESKVTVLAGGRGSGKTIGLLYATAPAQAWVLLGRAQTERWTPRLRHRFASEIPILGVHLYTDAARMRRLAWASGTQADSSAMAQAVFGHYLNCYALDKVLQTLVELESVGALRIAPSRASQLGVVLADHFGMSSPDSTLVGLRAAMRGIRARADGVLSDPRSRGLFEFPRPLTLLGAPLHDFAEELMKGEFSGRSLTLLIDEYENFTTEQQVEVNGVLKAAATPLLVKVAMRPHRWNFETPNPNEPLRRVHDYDLIDLEEGLFTSAELKKGREFFQLVSSIARKRLSSHRYFGKLGQSDWSSFLPSAGTPEEEAARAFASASDDERQRVRAELESAMQLVHDLPAKELEAQTKLLVAETRPLLTLLNAVVVRRRPQIDEVRRLQQQFEAFVQGAKSPAYAELVDKNQASLLLRLLSLLRKRKMYAGFDLVVTLASGIVRNFLELSFQLYEVGAAAGYLHGLKPIPQEVQTSGVERAADVLLREAAADRKFGPRIRGLTEAVGSLFRELEDEDDRIREPELSHFTVDYGALSDTTRTVLDAAVGLSVFQVKEAMRDKRHEMARSRDFVLSRTLVPRYRISPRVRGVVRLQAQEVESMAEAETEEEVRVAVNATARRILAGQRPQKGNQARLPFETH